jgi:dTMP kinase
MKKKPAFIVFEGIDGSGKSTQSQILAERLRQAGLNIVLLREPGDSPAGAKIRAMLRNAPPSPREQVSLFIEDRVYDFSANIRPAIENGIHVIMDRYYFSNAAYQGAAGLDPAEIILLNRGMGFPEPDRVYLFDLCPAAALKRVRARGETEAFERETFLEKVRNIYLSTADQRFVIIDAERKETEISDLIFNDAISIVK